MYLYKSVIALYILGWLLSGCLSLVAPPPAIPQMPVNGRFPDPDERVMINQTYLNDPIIVNGLAYVESVVPANLLSIPLSRYILFGNVTYTADPAATCYWQQDQCVRATTGPWGQPDIVTCPNDYDWGLAYDDAPTSNLVGTSHVNDTTTLLAVLDQMNIKASFFVTGSQASYEGPTLQQIAKDNQHIAHHTWTHHPMTSLTNAQIVAEMLYTQAMIYNVTGLAPVYFRPPYGDIDDRVRAIVNALGFRVAIWVKGYDSRDSDVVPSAASYQPVLRTVQGWFNTKPGFISLQHTISTFTNGVAEDALKAIIAMGGIKNQMQAIPQCLGDTAWYRNKNVTTKFNTCTIPSGCGTTNSSTNATSTIPVMATEAVVNAKSCAATPQLSSTAVALIGLLSYVLL
ncbi:hypothetical protein SeMB42_g04349 [Synchytrium endobioticum]|uniref:NodB homology domain-containing protein n=1 Tax=Synchytrium endobioticum TaxID=286115 RepID=A0A507CZ25_9FUNG|nr:hypothetical protein SeMB42_g04349 [Synchytrium endobioticum]TPX49215.1 hypothetical protein SeLEV6574_g01617 [Synchytrium endobioticum]